MRTSLAAAVAAGIIMATMPAASALGTAVTYRSCTALHRDFPNGVARTAAAALRAVRAGAVRPRVDARVYSANRQRLDRAGDGVLCERERPSTAPPALEPTAADPPATTAAAADALPRDAYVAASTTVLGVGFSSTEFVSVSLSVDGGPFRPTTIVAVPGTTARLAYLPGAAFTPGSHTVAVSATLANGATVQVPGASVSVVEAPRNNAVTFAYGISGSLVTVEAALDGGGWTSIFPSCPTSGVDCALPPGYLAAHTFGSLQPNTTYSASLRVVTTVGVSAPLAFTFTTPPFGGSPNLGVVGSLVSPVP